MEPQLIAVFEFARGAVLTAFASMFLAVVVKAGFAEKFRRYTFQGLTVFFAWCIVTTALAQKRSMNEGLEGGRLADVLISQSPSPGMSVGMDEDVGKLRFDGISHGITSSFIVVNWAYGITFRNPILDILGKSVLSNDWNVVKTLDVGYDATNAIVEIFDDAVSTNTPAFSSFYAARLRTDPNPLRNTDGDYFTDMEELGYSEVCATNEYLWFDITSSGTKLTYPHYYWAALDKDVDFPSPHVFNGTAYSGARIKLEGVVCFKDAAQTVIDVDHCPSIRVFDFEPMADGIDWGSGVYYGTVADGDGIYDVIEYLNIGMYERIDEPTSPLISCEVIIPRSDPNTIYVSYANVDDEVRGLGSGLGYLDTTLESVLTSNDWYRIACPFDGLRPIPYSTVRYRIGSGTDPRVYDDYEPPVCGQSVSERIFVESSVGHNLTNGLYELTASVTNAPPVPVRIKVGDRSVTMTNCGECVFLCEKGVEYPLGVTPSYFSAVEFSARDDIAPPALSAALASSDSGGAVWTVDNRLTLVQPFGGAPGSCLWLPTFTAGPDVLGHWYPADGELRFTAYLTDYPGSGMVSYLWSSSKDDVVIDTPTSRSTGVSLVGCPGWGSVNLIAIANVDGYALTSSLTHLEYGEHFSPQVSLELDVPSAVLINSNVVCSAKLRKFELRFHSDLPADGIIRLRVNGDYDAVKLWTSTNCVTRIPYTQTWDAADFIDFSGYIEGVRVSSSTNDLNIEARYISTQGDDVIRRQEVTIVDFRFMPINNEWIMIDGHKSLVNPCALELNHKGAFGIDVWPLDYPDSKIVWSAVGGDGLFHGGNLGRRVIMSTDSVDCIGVSVDFADLPDVENLEASCISVGA